MYGSYIVKRTQIYLETDQDRRLTRRATALEAFRAALDSAQTLPAALPNGRSYVEDLRDADQRRDEEIEQRRR